MTSARDIERAERAKLLLGDDLFAEMLVATRMDAFMKLAETDVTNASEIQYQQAIIAVTDQIKSKLEAVVLAEGGQDGGYSMTESPQGE